MAKKVLPTNFMDDILNESMNREKKMDHYTER